MSYPRPSIQTLITRAQGDISSRTEGSAFIARGVERALANAAAGLTHGAHGHLEQLGLDYFATTGPIETLRAWGSLIGLAQKPATFAERQVTFTGTNGTNLPAAATMKDDDSLTYTVMTGGVVTGGTVTVTVRANTAGTTSNLAFGAPLTLVSPIAGIESEGAVSAETIDGADQEGTEAYRGRILGNLRTAPAGGGPGDYVTWALEVPGVTRAWEVGNRMGIGTVSVAFLRDNDVSPIPSSPEVDAVYDYIAARMPIDVRALYVQAPVALPVNMNIALSPNTVGVQNAVTAELTELFRREVSLETALALSKIDEAISIAAGEEDHDITFISSLMPGSWEILTLGTITFAGL